MALIIVESPTKARTFNRILKGKDYYVFATMGHFRDLPAKKIALDFDNNFAPVYKIMTSKAKMVATLKDLAKKNDEIILATDLDREGESISYHVACVLGIIKENWPDFQVKKGKVLKRIVFHEITSNALEDALAHPTGLRDNLVKAQQARRILDRIVGYKLSPLLWKKMSKRWLSAGRVQTSALRIIVEREKEILKFKAEPYFQIYGNFKDTVAFRGKLVQKNGEELERKFKLQLFDGEYTYTKTIIDDTIAQKYEAELKQDKFTISQISEDLVKKYPPPPFTTSLLQQESFRRFGYSSKMTMRLAQDLYERGLISYHRTDSFSLSTFFVFAAQKYISEKFGTEYALDKPRGFHNKSKSAQEAHEAIRPTSLKKEPDVAIDDKGLTVSHKKLYTLIFDRAVATQMKEAEVKQVKITVMSDKQYLFECSQQQVVFDGFLRILNPDYVTKNSDPMNLTKGSVLILENLELQKLDTAPPPRYNEASLIKTLEEKGIGRPSTYAPIISLIQEKNYIEKITRYFAPTKLGSAISDYLSTAFTQLFDLNFTAQMEEGLDRVANGEEDFIKLLKSFYQPFIKELELSQKDQSLIDVDEKIDEKCTECGAPMVMRYSKYGRFLGCSTYPACKHIKPFLQIIAGQKCPDCGGDIVARFTKTRRRFFGCANYPKCKYSSWKVLPKNNTAETRVTTTPDVKLLTAQTTVQKEAIKQ